MPTYTNENLPKSYWSGINSGILSGQHGRGEIAVLKATNAFPFLYVLDYIFIISIPMTPLTQHLLTKIGIFKLWMFQLTAEKAGFVFIISKKKNPTEIPQ